MSSTLDFKQRFISACRNVGNNPCGRYAPSPTGVQHLGNIRTALLAWLQARLVGGRFILRMDDLDLPRVKESSAEQIMDDLRWLGLDWDEGPDIGGPHAPYEQSLRTNQYQAAFERLQRKGLVYPCYCSRKDIQEAASAPHEPGHVMKYPGTCRPSGRAMAAQKPDIPPAWRIQVENQTRSFKDRLAGKTSQNLAAEVGDFIVKRRDGLFAYQLATVVDDIAMGVTDVLRGEDLLDSVPRQVLLFNTLGAQPPNFWHVPLMCDTDGIRLSKRDGANSLLKLRQASKSAEQIIGDLAQQMGLSDRSHLSSNDLLKYLRNAI